MALRLPATLLASVLLVTACGREPEPPAQTLDLASALRSDDPGFARADRPREFRFPADHGPHPEFRSEWWYVTGNLADRAGRRYGFQLTLFRLALASQPPERRSAWGTRDVYMGHFALTDAARGRFTAHERFARAAAGLAGARAAPFAVWLEDWRIEQDAEGWTLTAAAGGDNLNLRLRPETRPVLQGEAGLSRKSATPGNASYYYSLPRVTAAGSLARPGESVELSGSAWVDREWSTSALAPGQAGWDWFALQLEDGRELMYYRLRDKDGSLSAQSAGSLIGPGGEVRPVGPGDIALEPLGWWESPRGGRYPVEWRVTVAGLERPLRIRPLLPDQELALTVRYWEGAVTVEEEGGSGTVGRGYVELTGYAR